MRGFAGASAFVFLFGFAASAVIAQSKNLEEMLGGKTLTSPRGRTVYILGADGNLGGMIAKQTIVGTWEVRDGQWCRSIVEPKEHEGFACRVVEANGAEISLRDDEQTIVYSIK